MQCKPTIIRVIRVVKRLGVHHAFARLAFSAVKLFNDQRHCDCLVAACEQPLCQHEDPSRAHYKFLENYASSVLYRTVKLAEILLWELPTSMNRTVKHLLTYPAVTHDVELEVVFPSWRRQKAQLHQLPQILVTPPLLCHCGCLAVLLSIICFLIVISYCAICLLGNLQN